MVYLFGYHFVTITKNLITYHLTKKNLKLYHVYNFQSLKNFNDYIRICNAVFAQLIKIYEKCVLFFKFEKKKFVKYFKNMLKKYIIQIWHQIINITLNFELKNYQILREKKIKKATMVNWF